MYTKENIDILIEKVLIELGIKSGSYVLDCCCGTGTYTIPAARLVGEKGLVYAIDINGGKLNDLKQKVEANSLKNIIIIEKDVESKIPLPMNYVDIVFLYDIFWYFRPTENRITNLLKEVYRVAKSNALISVYPTHVNSYELRRFRNKMKNKGFSLESEYSKQLVHEENLETGNLLNYIKLKE